MIFKGTVETVCADGSPIVVTAPDPDLVVILVQTLVYRVMDFATFAETAMAIAARSLEGTQPIPLSAMLNLISEVSQCLTKGTLGI